MQLDDTYNRLDHRLTQQLDTVRVNINTIHDASVSSVNDICTYAALTFTVINSIFLTCLLRKFWNPIPLCLPLRRPAPVIHEPHLQPQNDPQPQDLLFES